MTIEPEQPSDMDDLIEALEEGGYTVAFAHKPTPEESKAAGERLALQDLELSALSGTLPPALIEWEPESRQRNIAWDERPDKLWLLTREEFERVPDGMTLVCINGKTKTKGADYIDQDIRGGFIAWGLLDSQLPPRAGYGQSKGGAE